MPNQTEREEEEARYFADGDDRDRRRVDRLLRALVQSVVSLPPPAFVAAHATVRTAARHMATSDVGAALVSGAGGRVIGVLNERDILVHVTAPGRDPDKVTVASCMSRVHASIGPRTTVAEALHLLMGLWRGGHVPVFDPTGEAVACLSARDLAAAFLPRARDAFDPSASQARPSFALIPEGA